MFDYRTQSNTNRSIVFDWFSVRFCSIRPPGHILTKAFKNKIGGSFPEFSDKVPPKIGAYQVSVDISDQPEI